MKNPFKALALLKPDLVLDYAPTRFGKGGRYLTRWNLGYKLGQLFPSIPGLPKAWNHTSRSVLLHKITGPDPDRLPHNHPWFAVCIILRGGYDQIVWRKEAGIRWDCWRESVSFVNVLYRAEYHKIVSVRPNTWTLTFTGNLLQRGWGFLGTYGRHVDHKEYLKGGKDDA